MKKQSPSGERFSAEPRRGNQLCESVKPIEEKA